MVTAACDGRPGLRALAASMVRRPRGWRWRLAALSPPAFLAVALLVAAALGRLPSPGETGATAPIVPGARTWGVRCVGALL